MATLALDGDGLPLVGDSCLSGTTKASSLRPSFEGAVHTGTTIVALKYAGGVVFGADSRTSSGPYVANRAARKITRLSENIFLCRSGSAADTQALANVCRLHLQQYGSELHQLQRPSHPRPPVKAAAHLLQRMCYEYKDQLTAGLIVGGVDGPSEAKLFALPLGGALVEVEYTAGGSGSAFISAFLDEHFRPGLTKEEAVRLVQRAVSFAISRDGASGGMVRVVAVDAESGVAEETHLLGNRLPVAP